MNATNLSAMLQKIADGLNSCSRPITNFFDWEYELEFQIRVAMCDDGHAFTIGCRLLCEGVKNPERKTLIAVCNETEYGLKKAFADQRYFDIPVNIRECGAFKDQFQRQKYGWVNPLEYK